MHFGIQDQEGGGAKRNLPQKKDDWKLGDEKKE